VTTSIDLMVLKQCLEAAADRILAETVTLTHADQAVGDGDHGIGMARGFTAVKEALGEEYASVPALLEKVGKTLMLKTGGSSGAIYGTLFIAGSKALPAPSLDSPLDAEGFARFLEAGLEGVQKRGNARPGDKTLVDALAPAAAAARAHCAESLSASFRAAAHAAREGMEATRNMTAAFGRAKTLGERALGHADPGALSMTIILEAISESLPS